MWNAARSRIFGFLESGESRNLAPEQIKVGDLMSLTCPLTAKAGCARKMRARIIDKPGTKQHREQRLAELNR
jgi:hypothetical protein